MQELTQATIVNGSIAVTRLYDIALEIDLDRIVQELSASTTRIRFTRAKPKAVFFAAAPVDIALGTMQLALTTGLIELDVRARVYDFGAASLSFEHRTQSMAWRDWVGLINEIDDGLDREAPWDRYVDRIRDLIRSALTRPSASGLQEDYLLATVQTFDPPVRADQVAAGLDLVPLLTGDVQPLSANARQDVLRHTYSYYHDDLVVISWSRAFLMEPRGETDVADVLAVANAQLLELRYYDERLDAEMRAMYDRIEQAREPVGGLARRRYADLARSLHRLVAEVTEVSERIDNALVVTEDVYLARVYAAAIEQFRVRVWGAAVDRKLAIIRDTYTALYDEATAGRAEYLEIAIVVLIIVEIVLAFIV